ncbi:MAG: hypothetical protein EAZ37_08515 [Burkholderiales bacterium]|nr:MAG: hypothetical protein EAZ37_08515 [Burkholderiales bacterium]
MAGWFPQVCVEKVKRRSVQQVWHRRTDATDAALRRKNQSEWAGLRHNQAPRQTAARTAT